MNDKTIELINRLAEKLGTTVDHLYAVLTKQAWVEFTNDALSAALLWVVTVSGFAVMYKMTRRNAEGRRSSTWEECAGGVFIFTLVAFTATIFTCMSVQDYVQAKMNPEYYAIRHILNAIR